MVRDSLLLGHRFDEYRMLDEGPLRTSFVLSTRTLRFGKRVLNADCVVSIDAGSDFTECKVRYSGDTSALSVAVGMDLTDSLHATDIRPKDAWVEAQEGLQPVNKKAQRLYTGLVFPFSWVKVVKTPQRVLCVFPYKVGQEFVYYVGTSRQGTGRKAVYAWRAALEAKRAALVHPLKIKILH